MHKVSYSRTGQVKSQRTPNTLGRRWILKNNCPLNWSATDATLYRLCNMFERFLSTKHFTDSDWIDNMEILSTNIFRLGMAERSHSIHTTFPVISNSIEFPMISHHSVIILSSCIDSKMFWLYASMVFINGLGRVSYWNNHSLWTLSLVWGQ